LQAHTFPLSSSRRRKRKIVYKYCTLFSSLARYTSLLSSGSGRAAAFDKASSYCAIAAGSMCTKGGAAGTCLTNSRVGALEEKKEINISRLVSSLLSSSHLFSSLVTVSVCEQFSKTVPRDSNSTATRFRHTANSKNRNICELRAEKSRNVKRP
jgi:hypothetical protein